ELAAQGHAYMTFAAPLVAAVLLLAAADVVARLAGARGPGSAGAPSPRLRRLWVVAAGFLFFASCFQESLEGALATRPPGGAAGLSAAQRARPAARLHPVGVGPSRRAGRFVKTMEVPNVTARALGRGRGGRGGRNRRVRDRELGRRQQPEDRKGLGDDYGEGR